MTVARDPLPTAVVAGRRRLTPERPSSLHAGQRARDLQALADGEVVDVLVVGGGVTGAGVALDAATRGLSVALVERCDLAHGTSRWSSKLVHGGLRYLAMGRVGLAHESAVERGVLMERTAPHLTRPLGLLAPILGSTSARDVAVTRAAFAATDLLRVAAGTASATLPRSRRVSRAEALRLVPGLVTDGLAGGVVQWEGQLVDDARLVIAVARTAAAFGARVVTYAEVEEVAGDGAVVRDRLSGGAWTVRARTVVNATGVWADRLHPEVTLRPSKGAHVLLPAEVLGHPRAAVTVPVPGERNRFVFALPQPDGVHVVVGLTDDPVEEVTDEPTADDVDVDFLLSALGRVLARPVTAGDVVGSYAGYRPLLEGAAGATADLSREHRILERADGLVTIVGGKLTTYRRMAADIVDHLVAAGRLHAGPSVTARQPLVGALPRRRLAGLDAPAAEVGRLGAEAEDVDGLARSRPELAAPLFDGSSHRLAALAWALDHEGALTVDDLLDRRLRVGLVPADRARALPAARALVADA